MKRTCLSCALIVLCLACFPVLAQNVSLPESIGRELGERYSDYALLAADDALAAGTPGEFAVIALTKDGESVLTVFRRLGEELYALALKSKTALRQDAQAVGLRAADSGWITVQYAGDDDGMPYQEDIHFLFGQAGALTFQYAGRHLINRDGQTQVRSLFALDGGLFQLCDERQDASGRRVSMARTWNLTCENASAPDADAVERLLSGPVPEQPPYLLELPAGVDVALPAETDLYTGPGDVYLRLEGGLGRLPAGETVSLIGFEGDWALLRYGLDDPVMGYYGYAPRASLPEGLQAPQLSLACEPLRTKKAYTVYDGMSGEEAAEIAAVRAGEEAELTYLFYTVEGHICVELRRTGKAPLRGFLKRTEL